MTNQTKELLRSQFLAFTMKAFAEMHPSQRMTKYPFLVLLAETLARVATGESKRVVVNLPPRHFKGASKNSSFSRAVRISCVRF